MPWFSLINRKVFVQKISKISSQTPDPQKAIVPGQMVPNQCGPPEQMVPRIFCLSRGQDVGIQKSGDQIGWGPFVQEDQLFGDHMSMGTEFDGDRLPTGDQFYGDGLSRGINFMGTVCPNVSQPNVLATKTS